MIVELIDRFVQYWEKAFREISMLHEHRHGHKAHLIFCSFTNHGGLNLNPSALVAGNANEAAILFSNPDGSPAASDPPFTKTPGTWSVSGPATSTPSEDGLSTELTLTGDGTLSVGWSATDDNGVAYSATASITCTGFSTTEPTTLTASIAFTSAPPAAAATPAA